jgi:hypothetical protein
MKAKAQRQGGIKEGLFIEYLGDIGLIVIS